MVLPSASGSKFYQFRKKRSGKESKTGQQKGGGGQNCKIKLSLISFIPLHQDAQHLITVESWVPWGQVVCSYL